MSFLHPTADVNSMGENPDPLTGDREKRANDYAAQAMEGWPNVTAYNPFSSWKRVTEDIIHFTPFDNLPQEEQDAIRARRRYAYRHSAVPWIITDYTSLMTAYDDVDDLLKTKTLIKDYALTPAATAAKRLVKGKNPFKDEKLAGWKEGCDIDVAPRTKKLAVPGFGGLNFLAALGLGALGVLFPSWRLAALLLQALQTTDSLFGVGLQLGPILGAVMELAFRTATPPGGLISPFENKYEQLKAARVIRDANRQLAASYHAHPDDAFTSLTGFYYATHTDLVPQLVIAPEDYPSLAEVFDNPWSPGAVVGNAAKEGFDAARLAFSLPYNLGALAVNNLLGDSLAGMSAYLGGPGDLGLPDYAPDNETRALMALAEQGICPAGQCEGELQMDAYLLYQRDGRHFPGVKGAITKQDLARNLLLRTDEGVSTPPPDQTPVPEGGP